MANQKITEYATAVTDLENGDLLDVSKDVGGLGTTFDSQKMTQTILRSTLGVNGTNKYIPLYNGTKIVPSVIYQSTTSAIGIFGVTSPTYSISLGGDTPRTFGIERRTGSTLGGVAFAIWGGGAASGSTDQDGGSVSIVSGIPTGSGNGKIIFSTAGGNGTGTTDRVPTGRAEFTGIGHFNLYTSKYIQVNGYTWLHYTNAGVSDPSTNGCTFLGYNSGLSNNGNGNTAVGQQAFRDIGNGTNNTAMGRFAGQETTSGVNNAFFGYYAGSGITTTSYNAFFGGYAGSQTTASYNTACGYNAMPNNTSGGYNTGVGNDALYSISSGTYNVGIGWSTLNGTTISGSYNTAVGANAGVYVRTTSAQNTFIGYNTGFLTGEGAFSYSVAIGAGAIVRASNTAVIGGYSNAQKISTVYFGSSAVYTQGDVVQSTVTLMAGGTYYNAGANMGGNNLAICAGLATGAGNAGTGSGNILLQTTSVGASGSTLGTATTRVTILGGTGYVGMQGITAPTAFLHLAASTTAAASLCIPSGTAPSSPVNGDIWSDGSDIKVRLGGVTYTLTKV